MLTIFDPRDRSSRFCDGLSRRNFLKIGALGAAGLTLPQLFQAEAAAGQRTSKKSVILVYLVGGPPHQDMFDLKPDAPAEIAGPMRPISTNVPGIQIGELFPRMASMMDKFAIIRSLSDAHVRPRCDSMLYGPHIKVGNQPAVGPSSVGGRQAARAGESGGPAVRQPVL
ncbi:MAG: DUF1501 domain-containing protein [Pirellulaceae bacterium]